MNIIFPFPVNEKEDKEENMEGQEQKETSLRKHFEQMWLLIHGAHWKQMSQISSVILRELI